MLTPTFDLRMDFKTKGRLSWAAYVLYSIRNRGLFRTCLMGYNEWRKERELGIRTFGSAAPKDLHLVCDDAGGGHLYQPTSSVLFHKALASLPVDVKGDVFFDVGSGKGRALVLAAEAGFKKVIGIEYATELSDMAIANIERVRSRFPNTEFDLHEGDAVAFGLPKGVHVVYLFNPFDEHTLKQWATAIVLQMEPGLHIIYMHPVFASALEETIPQLSTVLRSPDREFNIYRFNG